MGLPKQVADMDEESNKNLEEDANASLTPAERTVVETAAEATPPSTPKTEEVVDVPKGKAGILDKAASDEPDESVVETQVRNLWHSRIDAAHKQTAEATKAAEELRKQLSDKDAEIARLMDEINVIRNERPNAGEEFTQDQMALLKSKLGDGYSDEELRNFASAISIIAEAKTAGIRKEINDSKRREAKSNVDAFKARIESEFPGFMKMDAEDDPRWVAFLGTSLGGVMEGTTYGEVAAIAARRLDYRKFASIVREFAKVTGIQFSADGSGVDPAVAAQIRPRTVLAGVRRESQANRPVTFGRSEVNRFYRAYQARRAEQTYGLTPEQVAERIRQYEDAEAEGRVDESR